METLVANITGRPYRRTLQGREYVVAKATLLVPGVLNGSRGPLLYQVQDIEPTVPAWNNIPVTLNHPRAVTARTPDVIDKHGLGFVFNAGIDQGNLAAELWFDVAICNRVDSRVIPSVESGNRLEVSTGVHVTTVHNVGTHNGQNYIGLATNHKPDHLALLLDTVGACSVQDGCGVNNRDNDFSFSKEGVMPLTKQQRTDMVESLVTNCDCYSKDDAAALNELSDKVLGKLVDNLEKDSMIAKLEKANKGLTEEVENAKAKAANMDDKKKSEEEEASDEDKEGKGKDKEAPANNKQAQPKPLTMSDLPVELQSVMNYGMQAMTRDKNKLVERLVAGIEDEAVRNEHAKRLHTRSIEELAKDVELLPANNTQAEQLSLEDMAFEPLYGGQNVANNSGRDRFKPEPLPATNWDAVFNNKN